MDKYRKFLRDEIRLEMDFSKTDQNMGVDMPPLEKPYPEDAKIIELPGPDKWQNLGEISVKTAIRRRKSRRKYSPDKIGKDELAFLLWATAGIRKRLGGVTLRNVPSAGNHLTSRVSIREIEGKSFLILSISS